MRKVSATVIYKDNTLYNLTVNHKGVLIPLVAYDEISVKHPYEKRTFQTMYKSVLNILKTIISIVLIVSNSGNVGMIFNLSI
jgi:hypothetical protein